MAFCNDFTGLCLINSKDTLFSLGWVKLFVFWDIYRKLNALRSIYASPRSQEREKKEYQVKALIECRSESIPQIAFKGTEVVR